MNFETLLQDQGLAVALAVVLVGFLIWFVKRQSVIIEKHIKSNTEVLGSFKSSVDAQTEATKELTRYVRDQNGGRRQQYD